MRCRYKIWRENHILDSYCKIGFYCLWRLHLTLLIRNARSLFYLVSFFIVFYAVLNTFLSFFLVRLRFLIFFAIIIKSFCLSHVIDSLSNHINPFLNKPWFSRVCRRCLLKPLWEKEKLLVTSNFSFSHSVF